MQKKIAIFHDYFRVIGGAEKLVLTLAKALNADIITSEVNSESIKKSEFKGIKIISLSKPTKFPYILPMIARRNFEKCNFSKKYDFFIFSGTFSIYAARKHKPNLWYCHTPLKGLYTLLRKDKTIYSSIVDLKKSILPGRIIPENIAYLIDNSFNAWHEILISSKNLIKQSATLTNEKQKIKPKEKNIKTNPSPNLLINFFLSILAYIRHRKYQIKKESDKSAVENIEEIIVNSKNIQNKVKEYYSKNSTVINPPIETTQLNHKPSKDYWLSVNRLTPEKRINLQIKAFEKLPNEKLKIIGGYEQNDLYQIKELINKKLNNVEFLGEISEKELIDYYANCKGFITTAKDEDFGMTPLEAMASGKPVIAPNEGGYKETIINNETGILIEDINEDKLASAIKQISNELKTKKIQKKYKKDCQQQAKKFDTNVFINKIKQEINKDNSLISY